jgi:hypothetical protein
MNLLSQKQLMRKCNPLRSEIRNNELMVLIKEVIFCEPIKKVNSVHYPHIQK